MSGSTPAPPPPPQQGDDEPVRDPERQTTVTVALKPGGAALRLRVVSKPPDTIAAARLLSDAFARSPAWAHIFGRGKDYAAPPRAQSEGEAPPLDDLGLFYVAWLRLTQLSDQMHFRVALSDEDGPAGAEGGEGRLPGRGAVVCTYTLAVGEASLWEQLRAGLWRLPYDIGLGSTLRLLRAAAWFGEHMQTVTKGEPCVGLDRMAVAPAFQGRGIGNQVLLRALTDPADPLARLPCVLSTQLARNVTFYQRLGFVVVKTVPHPHDLGTTSWFMRREPSV